MLLTSQPSEKTTHYLSITKTTDFEQFTTDFTNAPTHVY